MLQRGQRVGGFAALRDGDDQRVRVRHAVAIAVFAGDFDVDRHFGNRFYPVFCGQSGVIAGAAGQDQHRVDLLEYGEGLIAEQLRHDGLDPFERVADGARLLENFFLHVVAIGAEFGRAGMHVHGMHFALRRLALRVDDPDPLQLQVDHVAFFQIDDLVGGAGQRHRVGRQEVLALADADDQRRAVTRADHPVWLVTAEHRDRIGAGQAFDRLLHGLEQVAGIQMVDQMRDHFGIGLALEHIAERGEFGAQLVVIFDDAVVHQRNPLARKMRVRIVRGGRAMRGPAGVRDAGEAGQAGLRNLLFQLGHARGAARASQLAVDM